MSYSVIIEDTSQLLNAVTSRHAPLPSERSFIGPCMAHESGAIFLDLDYLFVGRDLTCERPGGRAEPVKFKFASQDPYGSPAEPLQDRLQASPGSKDRKVDLRLPVEDRGKRVLGAVRNRASIPDLGFGCTHCRTLKTFFIQAQVKPHKVL